MCDSKGRWLGGLFHGLGGFGIADLGYKSAKRKDAATIAAINQEKQQKLEANKIANSTQSTEEITNNQNLNKKKLTQKVPLNTFNTGVTIGNQSSIGLNLGGY